jgi:carbamoyl-phosphate synthase large subunit
VPRCTAPDFIGAMAEVCRDNAVDLSVPTIDTELQILSQNIARFDAVGARVHVSDPETIAIVRELQNAGIPAP